MLSRRVQEEFAQELCRQALLRMASRAWREEDHFGEGDCEERLRAEALALLDTHRGWLLPALGKLIARHAHEQPMVFALHARQFVDEHTFIGNAGDVVFDGRTSEEAQLLVELALRVQRAVSHQTTARTPWHAHPSAPQMCG